MYGVAVKYNKRGEWCLLTRTFKTRSDAMTHLQEWVYDNNQDLTSGFVFYFEKS